MRAKQTVDPAALSASAVLECPRCKLINPVGSLRCDCGYDFAVHVMPDEHTGRCEACGVDGAVGGTYRFFYAQITSVSGFGIFSRIDSITYRMEGSGQGFICRGCSRKHLRRRIVAGRLTMAALLLLTIGSDWGGAFLLGSLSLFLAMLAFLCTEESGISERERLELFAWKLNRGRIETRLSKSLEGFSTKRTAKIFGVG